jgi:hypothetical protein
LSTLTADHVIALLTEYTRQTGIPLDVLLVGALALQAYGYQNRLTRDVDAEVAGSVEALAGFFHQRQIPADLTSNFSGWSIVAMPPVGIAIVRRTWWITRISAYSSWHQSTS